MGTMSLSEIMDRSIEILKKYIKTIIIFNLAYWVIIFSVIFGVTIVGGILTVIAIEFELSWLLIGSVFFILAIGVFAFIMSSKIGLIKISSQEFLEEKVYASQAIGSSLKKTIKISLVLLLEILLFVPVALVFIGVGYLIYNRFQKSMLFLGIFDKNELTLIILISVVALLAILTIIAYITILSFSFHALAIEDRGPLTALKRSYYLVKGDFFKILGYIILFNLSIYAITISVQSFIGILASIIYFILKFLTVERDLITYATVVYGYSQWPISILTGLVISPLGTIMITQLYYNQRFIKEGYDIVLMLNKIEKDEKKEQFSEGI